MKAVPEKESGIRMSRALIIQETLRNASLPLGGEQADDGLSTALFRRKGGCEIDEIASTRAQKARPCFSVLRAGSGRLMQHRQPPSRSGAR